MTRRRLGACAAALSVMVTGGIEAHKPITSPFTFSADVGPILADRCGRCHAPGGVAPMSLLTHIDALPWGESMRGELMAGHMPPWSIDRGGSQFRNAGGLTARELNVLLTWLTGGTPPGDAAAPSKMAPPSSGWALGPPDEVIVLPRFTLGEDEQERVTEFVVAGVPPQRWLRAVDLLPGNPAIVRSATIAIRGDWPSRPVQPERLLALWVPGDEPLSLNVAALEVPSGAELVVRVHYRKTWEYERKALSDESRLGLYAASTRAAPLQSVSVSPGAPVTLPRAARALAIYPDATLADVGVTVIATQPDGRRREMIAFHPRRGWARRYWLREPLALARGTQLSARIVPDSPALLPPGFLEPPPSPAALTARIAINVVE